MRISLIAEAESLTKDWFKKKRKKKEIKKNRDDVPLIIALTWSSRNPNFRVSACTYEVAELSYAEERS